MIKRKKIMNYTFNRTYPATRLRRLRVSDNIRDMVAETHLKPCHLIAPVFVLDGKNRKESIASMPDVWRLSIDLLIDYAKELSNVGVNMVDIFPVIQPSLKTPTG